MQPGKVCREGTSVGGGDPSSSPAGAETTRLLCPDNGATTSEVSERAW